MDWLRRLQTSFKIWVSRNFTVPSDTEQDVLLKEVRMTRPLLGAMEELGELSHAHLKQVQGIRGTAEEHEAAAKDAVGDVVVYLLDYCNQRGWDFAEILDNVAGQVLKRDWVANPGDGSS